MSEKIMTMHPQHKSGVNLDRNKYKLVKTAIIDTLGVEREMTFQELTLSVEDCLDGFEGSVPWYVTTIKLDLEARGMIERVPGKKPQHLRLTAAPKEMGDYQRSNL